MDFKAALPIQEALREVVERGIFGYTRHTEAFYDAVVHRFKTHWKREIQPSWIKHSATIISAVGFCIQGMTHEGAGIVLPTPIYHPFQRLIRENGRTLLECPLVYSDGRYSLDFDGLESLLARPETEMLIFCNPHNPVGRAWTSDELDAVCSLCLKHDVIL